MSAVFNTTIIQPSIRTSTYQKEYCSEIFTLFADRQEDTTDLDIEDLTAATPDAAGDIYRILSSGWSTLLVWEVVDRVGFRGANAKLTHSLSVIGKRDAYQLETSAISTGDVAVVAESAAWFPCAIKPANVVPGKASNDTTPNIPPMGSHCVSSTFTFGTDTNPVGSGLDGMNVADYGVISVALSSTNNTKIVGPAMIDVAGTKEIALLPVRNSATDTTGYLIGQFIN